MTAFVSKALLPIVLAFVMLGMGMALEGRDFRRIATQPRDVALGIGLQVIALPLLASGSPWPSLWSPWPPRGSS